MHFQFSDLYNLSEPSKWNITNSKSDIAYREAQKGNENKPSDKAQINHRHTDLTLFSENKEQRHSISNFFQKLSLRVYHLMAIKIYDVYGGIYLDYKSIIFNSKSCQNITHKPEPVVTITMGSVAES